MSALAPGDDFPATARKLRDGRRFIYLDSAATSFKPRAVIEAVGRYDREFPANVHRATHVLGERATEAYEGAREDVASFLGADPKTVIFTRGTTDAIHLVAHGLRLGPHDRVLAPPVEHHSNLVPWLRAARLEPLPVRADGGLDVAGALAAIRAGPAPRLVALAWTSHVTGGTRPVREVIAAARARGVPVLVDAAQAAPHRALDVAGLGADFVALSGHKMLGPTGIGVLTGRREALEALDPGLGGGGAVERVALEGVTWKPLPWRLEAGTPPIAQAIGLGAAARYLDALGMDRVEAHAAAVAAALGEALRGIDGVTLHEEEDGPGRAPIASFTVRGLAPEGVARALQDRFGLLVRAGNLCAQPALAHLGCPGGVVRASAHVYTSVDDAAALGRAVRAIAGTLAT